MNVIEKLLTEISIDSRIDDGMFDVLKSNHIDILREYLIGKSIPTALINECIGKLIEGKYPDRQAYNEEGYLSTFSSPEKMKEAIRAGTHFEEDPVKERDDKPKKKSDSEEYKKPKGDEEKEEEEETESEDGKEPEGGWGELTSKGKRGRPKKTKEGESEEEAEPEEKKEKPAPPKPEEPWKQTAEDTKKRARALGWKESESGDWHFEDKLVAITDKDGYVIPVKDGDRTMHTDWPKKQDES